MYQLVKQPSDFYVKKGDLLIPKVEDNSDYQLFLKWLDDGNIVKQADEQDL